MGLPGMVLHKQPRGQSGAAGAELGSQEASGTEVGRVPGGQANQAHEGRVTGRQDLEKQGGHAALWRRGGQDRRLWTSLERG